MNAEGHFNFSAYTIISIGVGFAIGAFLPLPSTTDVIELLGGIYTGTPLPDADHHKTLLGKILLIPKIHNLMKKIEKWINSNRVGKKKIKLDWFKHGGITHTMLLNILIFGIAIKLNSIFIYGIGIGFAGHLYIDHVTGNKLPMLYWGMKLLLICGSICGIGFIILSLIKKGMI